MKIKTTIAISMILMIIALASIVSAFGVASPYWEGKPMTIARGETKIVDLNLQNMVGEEDVTVSAEILEGAEIASLDKETYTVVAGTSDTIAPLRVKVGGDVEAGEVKKVKVEFKTRVSNEAGAITTGTGMTISFDVVVSDEVAETSPTIYVIIALIAVVLAIAAIILSQKKQKAK